MAARVEEETGLRGVEEVMETVVEEVMEMVVEVTGLQAEGRQAVVRGRPGAGEILLGEEKVLRVAGILLVEEKGPGVGARE